jgi:hypothetical protein
MPDEPVQKPQPTIRGYNAWVFRRLLEARGDGSGPLAEWIIDRWIEQNRELLANEYDIRREQYMRGQKVVRHPRSQ